MEERSIYKDIESRTGGDIYIAYLILGFSKSDREECYLDHPDSPGVLVLIKE